MENILFEYPVNNENSSFDDEFQVQKARTNKIKYTVIIAVFCALVMYFLSALFAKAALLFYLLTAFFYYPCNGNRKDVCEISKAFSLYKGNGK